ncbi:MAC/perforin domain-containing protein [Chitinophaga sp. Hz27]|uniref:MAC/perforin domain-containing protein n=1 Tax=Chitinophaga sp. Hz27 TaxID=3347169 RepID=UPI0035D935CC
MLTKRSLQWSPMLLSMAIFFGCAKQQNTQDSLSPTRTVAKTETAGDGKYDLLGYGYDATGQFANAASATFPVLDITKLENESLSSILLESAPSQEYVEDYGENAYQYSKRISTKVEATGAYSIFKATISYNYNGADAFNAKYIYGSYNLLVKQKRVRLNATKEFLASYLTAGFKSAVQTMTAAQLISNYGTHVLVDLYTGAKMDIMYQAETNSRNGSSAASGGVRVAVGSIFNINVATSTDVSNASQNYSRKLIYKTRGGDPSKGLVGQINLDQNAPQVNFAQWQNSCTPANSVLIDIAPKGLIPLYEFITDANKKAEVMNYITQYLQNNQVNLAYDKVPVYAYYNAGNNKHIFELDRRLDSDPNWQYRGPYFYAYKQQAPGTVPVYHFYAPTTGDNQYSLSTSNDYNYWNLDGIKWYAYSTQQAGTVPIYQFYHFTTGREHFLGSSPTSAPANEWSKSILFYAY